MPPKTHSINIAAPNLLRGILVTLIGITVLILATTWFIINSQVEQLVTHRTSEYAHSIARIAADSSSEPLLSDDILQLNLLVENVARDPYIKQATVYSEDGQIVSQYPSEETLLSNQQVIEKAQNEITQELNSTQKGRKGKLLTNSLPSKSSREFMERQQNTPFIEAITYQEITAGWFKIEIDSALLEQKFRDAYFQIQLLSAGISIALLMLMLGIFFKFELSIKKLTQSCQHLLLQHKIKPPIRKKLWLNAIETLASQPPQQLREHLRMPASHTPWSQSRKIDNQLICILEFDISIAEAEPIAESLATANHYLNSAVQAYGVQSQGDILTGCVVPFISNSSPIQSPGINQLSEILCFISLVAKLMKSIPCRIQMKSCITRASLLLLEDQHELVTGISILDGLANDIRQLLMSSESDTSVSLSIDPAELETWVKTTVIPDNRIGERIALSLFDLQPEFTQQITRKFSYITQSTEESR